MAARFDPNNPPNIPSLQGGLSDQFVKKPKSTSANWVDELNIRLGETKQEKIDEIRETNPTLARELEDLKRAYAKEIEERNKKREAIINNPVVPTIIKQDVLQQKGLATPETDRRLANGNIKIKSVPKRSLLFAGDFKDGVPAGVPQYQGYCFPECDNTEITSQLNQMIPKLYIRRWETGTFPQLFQNFIRGLNLLKNNAFSSGQDLQSSTLTEMYRNLDSSNSGSLPKSINLLFGSIPWKGNPECEIVLPITSTPLSINSQLDHGWKSNQSIFEFIKKQIGGSSAFGEFFGQVFGNLGKTVLNYTGTATAITENLMHIFGRDIQLGPYWSIGDGVLDNRQTLSFNTILVNDSPAHYIANAKILVQLFFNSLPMAYIGSYKLRPPSLFDIQLDTCVAGKKKYYMCTGQFSCEAKGKYIGIDSKSKIPEAYSLSLTFNSLIPDLLAIQQNAQR